MYPKEVYNATDSSYYRLHHLKTTKILQTLFHKEKHIPGTRRPYAELSQVFAKEYRLFKTKTSNYEFVSP